METWRVGDLVAVALVGTGRQSSVTSEEWSEVCAVFFRIQLTVHNNRVYRLFEDHVFVDVVFVGSKFMNPAIWDFDTGVCTVDILSTIKPSLAVFVPPIQQIKLSTESTCVVLIVLCACLLNGISDGSCTNVAEILPCHLFEVLVLGLLWYLSASIPNN